MKRYCINDIRKIVKGLLFRNFETKRFFSPEYRVQRLGHNMLSSLRYINILYVNLCLIHEYKIVAVEFGRTVIDNYQQKVEFEKWEKNRSIARFLRTEIPITAAKMIDSVGIKSHKINDP